MCDEIETRKRGEREKRQRKTLSLCIQQSQTDVGRGLKDLTITQNDLQSKL